jgi:Putative prokaryotic signal transducing protein
MLEERPAHTFQAEDGTTWVEIADAPNSDEAQLIQGFLEAEDIEAQVEHAEASLFPTNVGALGDVRVYVPQDQVDVALQILSQREKEFARLGDDEETLVTDDGVAEVDETE